jgi:hypothetical protein
MYSGIGRTTFRNVGTSRHGTESRSSQLARRRVASMSLKAGAALLVYHGICGTRAARVCWPHFTYQSTTNV